MMTRYAARQSMRLALALVALQVAQFALAETDRPSAERLTGALDYWFVGHLKQKDDEGRVLVWEAEIEGDLQGTMKWWFQVPPPVGEVSYTGGRLTFYAARWELWNGEELLLAGESAGKTNFRDGSDGVWDGHGRVTEAAAKYRSLEGRLVYETGPVIIGSNPPESYTGTGLFVIY